MECRRIELPKLSHTELICTQWDFFKSYLARGLLRWLGGNESACRWRRTSSVLGLGRSPAGGKGNPLQYSCLENAKASGLQSTRGAWWATVHGVTKEWDTTWRLNTSSKLTRKLVWTFLTVQKIGGWLLNCFLIVFFSKTSFCFLHTLHRYPA